MTTLLEEIYRLQNEMQDLDAHERLTLKFCANLLEGYSRVPAPQNRLSDEEFFAIPQRWEMVDGLLYDCDRTSFRICPAGTELGSAFRTGAWPHTGQAPTRKPLM